MEIDAFVLRSDLVLGFHGWLAMTKTRLVIKRKQQSGLLYNCAIGNIELREIG
jgi:hypothetical protein